MILGVTVDGHFLPCIINMYYFPGITTYFLRQFYGAKIRLEIFRTTIRNEPLSHGINMVSLKI